MKTAKCGHKVDVWWKPTNMVCQGCFGLEYTRNSFRTGDVPTLARKRIVVWRHTSGKTTFDYDLKNA